MKGINLFKAISTLVILLGIGFGLFYQFDSGIELIKDNEIDVSFNGKVNEKFLDPEERHQPRIVLDDGIKYRITNGKAYRRIKIGDRVLKKIRVFEISNYYRC